MEDDMNPTQAEAMEALASVEAWLETWARHAGNCRGRGACTCGLSRIRNDCGIAKIGFEAILQQPVAMSNGDVRELLRRFDAAGKDLEDCRKRLGEIHVWECSFDGKGLASERIRQAIAVSDDSEAFGE